MIAEREHILSLDCWCQPHVLAYGEGLEFDEAGVLVGFVTEDDDDR